MLKPVVTSPAKPRTPLAGAIAAILLLGLASPFASAQSAKDGHDQLPSGPPGKPAASDDKPTAPGSKAPPPAGPQANLPAPRPDGARPLESLPQTADEKARKLSDLYAQLATADGEEAAKKLALQIERLWRISGSDTINLLVGRANKAMADDHMDLAEKLLDEAIALAPDYTEGFSQRAFLHFKQNNLRAAAGDLRRVLALDPNHYKAMEGLAQIWRETGNKKGAYEVMKHLLEVNPFAPGLKQTFDELKREVEGQGI